MLRREFRIFEGQSMNMGIFKASVFKVNALGYWKLEEEPLEFDFDDENKKVNVKVKGNEVGRNDIQFGAGYSELDGFFVQGQFNTRNFLGRGNTLGVSLQIGRRSDLYSLSATPSPTSSIAEFSSVVRSSRTIDYSQAGFSSYQRETTGFTMSMGLGVGPFSSVSGVLAFQDDYSRYLTSNGGFVGDPTAGHDRPVDIPPVDGATYERAFEIFSGRTHSFTPVYNNDSRDDPFDPSRGQALSRPTPNGRRDSRRRFRLRPPGDLHFTQLYGLWPRRSSWPTTSRLGQFFTYNDSEIPLYERYRLGGDRSLRGIPYYSVLPRTAEGRTFSPTGGSRIGGDRYWQVNLEYQFRSVARSSWCLSSTWGTPITRSRDGISPCGGGPPESR